MFYFVQACLAWMVAIWLIDWKRLRELIPFGLLGSLICAANDNVSLSLGGLWTYSDTRVFNTHPRISVLIALSGAPLMGMYYIQGMRADAPYPWRRILAFSAMAMIPETVGLYLGKIEYGGWWSYPLSILAYLLMWSGFWAFRRWLDGRTVESARI